MTTLAGSGGAAQARSARGAAVGSHAALIGDSTASGNAADAVALGIVDATLAGDVPALQDALAALRDRRHALASDPEAQEAAGAAGALASTAGWALERLPSATEAELVARGTLAARFLEALAGGAPVASADLRPLLDTDDTQVSRTGRTLLDAGLVVRAKVGRTVSWRLSPRGRRALEALEAGPGGGPPRRSDEPADDEPGGAGWWRDVMRRAWVAPAGDRHEASGDPERDRIVAAALELHMRQGVLETTWPDIAELAGVPVSAVDERFATVEELVPACGGLAFSRLRVPPPDEAAGLFAGDDPDERLDTLVTTLFGIYDRAALGLEVLRREGERLPVLARSRDAIEEGIDALIAAALDPVTDDAGAVAVVRGLAGLPVWRALRSAGVDEDVAVGLVAGAVATAFSVARD